MMHLRCPLMVLAITAIPSIAVAQVFPAKSVRLIVPASPGGGLDIMAHMLGQALFPVWGQAVVVAVQGYDVQTSTPEEFGALIRGELAKYARVIREANIREH